MIDITEEVEVKPAGERIPGKWTPDKLVYKGETIGHMECQGPVTDSPAYYTCFKPNRAGIFERRYYALEPHELDPNGAKP